MERTVSRQTDAISTLATLKSTHELHWLTPPTSCFPTRICQMQFLQFLVHFLFGMKIWIFNRQTDAIPTLTHSSLPRNNTGWTIPRDFRPIRSLKKCALNSLMHTFINAPRGLSS